MSGTKYEPICVRVSKTVEEVSETLDKLRVSWGAMVRQIDEVNDYEGIPAEYLRYTSGYKVAVNFFGTVNLPLSFKKNWVVQIYIMEMEAQCTVHLVAVGSSSAHKFWHGKSQSIDLKHSIERRNSVADVLVNALS